MSYRALTLWVVCAITYVKNPDVHPSKPTTKPMPIRHATSADLPQIMDLIHLKANFDGCPGSVTATPEKLEQTLFSSQPMAHILLADVEASKTQTAVGFASYHFTYSTFLAQPSIWLDDIFIKQAFRNQSIGAKLIEQLCEIAVEHGCGRIDWTVDVDNAAGIRFYQRMGGKLQTNVHLCRLTQPAIKQVVSGELERYEGEALAHGQQ